MQGIFSNNSKKRYSCSGLCLADRINIMTPLVKIAAVFFNFGKSKLFKLLKI